MLGAGAVLARPAAAATDRSVAAAWYPKPPRDGTALATIAEKYDLVVLTHADERARDEILAHNPSAHVLQYILFNTIADPGSASRQPWRNQVAWEKGDFRRLLANSNWFLRDRAGRPVIEDIGPGGVKYYMDPASWGWRRYWTGRALDGLQRWGWQHIFLDNVDITLERFERAGIELDRYGSDAEWQDAVFGFLKRMRYDLRPAGPQLWANITAWRGELAAVDRYRAHLHGDLDEGFGVGWHDDYRGVGAWNHSLERAERGLATPGRQLMLFAQSDRLGEDLKRERFAFASYLLVAEPGRTFFRMGDTDAYMTHYWNPLYDVRLGAPRGGRYESNGRWYRDFERGQVMVDPQAQRAEISQNPS